MSAQAALEQIEGATVHRLVDLPADLRYALPSRTGDLVAIAPRGAYFSDGGGPARPARGMHGFPPDEMEMRGIFRAWGAGVKKGARMDSLRAVDVAPFVCRLLGMDPAAGLDGRVPEGLLSGPRGPGSAPP